MMNCAALPVGGQDGDYGNECQTSVSCSASRHLPNIESKSGPENRKESADGVFGVINVTSAMLQKKIF